MATTRQVEKTITKKTIMRVLEVTTTVAVSIMGEVVEGAGREGVEGVAGAGGEGVDPKAQHEGYVLLMN